MKKWITNCPEVFCENEAALDLLEDIMTILKVKGSFRSITQKVFVRYESSKHLFSVENTINTIHTTTQLLDYNMDDLARQFALSEHTFFKKLNFMNYVVNNGLKKMVIFDLRMSQNASIDSMKLDFGPQRRFC